MATHILCIIIYILARSSKVDKVCTSRLQIQICETLDHSIRTIQTITLPTSPQVTELYNKSIITVSGIHMILVVGYGWSNVCLETKSDVSSSSDTIWTYNDIQQIRYLSYLNEMDLNENKFYRTITSLMNNDNNFPEAWTSVTGLAPLSHFICPWRAVAGLTIFVSNL